MQTSLHIVNAELKNANKMCTPKKIVNKSSYKNGICAKETIDMKDINSWKEENSQH